MKRFSRIRKLKKDLMKIEIVSSTFDSIMNLLNQPKGSNYKPEPFGIPTDIVDASGNIHIPNYLAIANVWQLLHFAGNKIKEEIIMLGGDYKKKYQKW